MGRNVVYYSDELYHHGVKGMKWGVRRYQNPDGSLTAAGRRHRVTGYIETAGSKISGGVRNAGNAVKNKYNSLSDRQKTALKIAGGAVLGAAALYGGNKAYQFAKNNSAKIQLASNYVKGLGGMAARDLSSAARTAGTAAKNFGNRLADTTPADVGRAVRNAAGSAATRARLAGSYVQGLGGMAARGARNTARNVGTAVGNAARKAANTTPADVGRAVRNAAGSAATRARLAGSYVQGLGGMAARGARGAALSTTATLNNAGYNVGNAARRAGTAAGNAARRAGTAVGNAARKAANTSARDVGRAIGNAARRTGTAARNAAGSAATRARLAGSYIQGVGGMAARGARNTYQYARDVADYAKKRRRS